MKLANFLLSVFAILTLAQAQAAPAEDFAAACAKLGAAAERHASPGEDPKWYFGTQEMLHTGTGEFWKKPWATTAANGQDPVPFLVHFQQLLAAKGVDLLIVPVPAKTTIYPDKVDSGFKPGDPFATKPFYEILEAAGLTVLDLEPVFAEERANGAKMHCEQDAHYTPYACEVIAKLIAERIGDEDWFRAQSRPLKITRGPATELGIVGDQAPEELRNSIGETLKLSYCGVNEGGKIVPVEPDQDSPILLLGDSHTFVFQEGATGGMHCRGAGLLDNLQVETGFACDLVGVRGSGTKNARIDLYRRAVANPDYWSKKKFVVWCFSVREFTQSLDKLAEVPLEKS